MNCEKCKTLMRLEATDGRDYWICEKCEIGFLANPKKNCEHEDVSFGVDNSAYCYDCGNLIAYSKGKHNMNGYCFQCAKYIENDEIKTTIIEGLKVVVCSDCWNIKGEYHIKEVK